MISLFNLVLPNNMTVIFSLTIDLTNSKVIPCAPPEANNTDFSGSLKSISCKFFFINVISYLLPFS